MIVNIPKKEEGLTLIEIVVTLAIMGIVLSAIWSFFSFGNIVFAVGSEKSNAQSDTRISMQAITKKIQYASEVELLNTVPNDTDYDYIYISGTNINYKSYDSASSAWTEQVIARNIDSSTTYFAMASGSNDTLKIIIDSTDGKQNFLVDSSVKLLNLSLQPTNTSITGSGSKVIAFKSTASTVAPTSSIAVTNIDNVTGSGGVQTIIVSGQSLNMVCDVLPLTATNKNVNWSVNDMSIATIDVSTGVLTPIKNGTVTITATAKDSSGISGSVTIVISNQSVVPILVTSITDVTGNGGISTIASNGGNLQMVCTVSPSNATNQTVTWSVSDSTYATINSTTGILTAAKNGTVKVTATSTDGTAKSGTSGNITISGQIETATSVTVQGAGGSTTITTSNGTLQMSSTVYPSAASQAVSWSVDSVYATINSTGKLTALGNGKVNVTATSVSDPLIFGSKEITITGQPVLEIKNAVNANIRKNKTYTFTPIGSGGVSPYYYSYSYVITSDDGNVSSSGNSLIWKVPNLQNKTIKFTVTITDEISKETKSYNVTFTSKNTGLSN